MKYNSDTIHGENWLWEKNFQAFFVQRVKFLFPFFVVSVSFPAVLEPYIKWQIRMSPFYNLSLNVFWMAIWLKKWMTEFIESDNFWGRKFPKMKREPTTSDQTSQSHSSVIFDT